MTRCVVLSPTDALSRETFPNRLARGLADPGKAPLTTIAWSGGSLVIR